MNMHVAGAPMGDNTRAFRDDLIENVKALGQAEGQGVNSRPELAAQVTAASYDGHVSSDVNTPDIADIWTAYYQAMSAAKGDKASGPQASAEQQISKLRTFAKLGELCASPNVRFDAATYIGRVREVINTTDGAKGSTFDNMVKVARETNKAGAILTDEEIRTHVLPTEKDDVSDDERELKELEKAHKSLTKLRDGTNEKSPRPSAEIDAVIENLGARMAALTVELKRAELDKAQSKMFTVVKRQPLTADEQATLAA